MQNPLDQKIRSLAHVLHKRSVTIRRDLHRIPETAWQEHKTSAYLKKTLADSGIRFKSVASTGILAEISSGKGRCVAIRTDIDALPIEEQTGYPFRSVHPGRMHACGHDMHMATVTTAAIMLSRLKEHFHGTVKILYQPSEEEPPGGALKLIKEGVLSHPKVDMIFGMHVNSAYPTGTIAVRDGAFFAGVLDFDVTVTGIGGHGAIPHRTADPIVCTSAVVTALQTIVARNIDPFEPAVVTIGRIEGGTARNIIPPTCRLFGTARAQSAATLQILKKRIEMIVTGIARSHKCKAAINYIASYPPLINHSMANRFITGSAITLFGAKSIKKILHPSMGGEDFARYVQAVPGAMFFLGVGNAKLGAVHAWHHPKFKADEEAIPIGAAVLTKSAIDFLNE